MTAFVAAVASTWPNPLPAPPWRAGGDGDAAAQRGRAGEVQEAHAIALPVSPEVALAWVRDIANIALTEVKADKVRVYPDSEAGGTYTVRGRFAGIPWEGEFRYDLHPGGFHSVQCDRKRFHPQVSGGFSVLPFGDGGCVVLHYEQYLLPRWARPVRPAFAGYIRHSMRIELADLARFLGPSPERPARPVLLRAAG